jgi:hypothetical protein
MGESFSTASTTAKNFSDWILRFRKIVRQAKIRYEVIHSLNN